MTRFQDHSKIVWRVHLRSSPQRVYELLNSGVGREAFWAESAQETDGVIEFRFINGTCTSGRILKRTEPSRFVLEYFNSRVEFELAADGQGGTDLTLTNTGFDPEDYLEILPGWLNVLFPLKAAADFDIDLRSRDPARTWDDGYIDQ